MTTTQKLEKIAQSFSNYVRRGGRNQSSRAYDLIDRYTDLRAQAIKEGVWTEFCNQKHWSIESDAYDFFA